MVAIGNDGTGRARLRAPGVHLEWTIPPEPSVFRTGIPLFIGFVEQHATSVDEAQGNPHFLHWETALEQCQAVQLAAWEEFERHVGRAASTSFLDYAVRGFFENGGERCVVVSLFGKMDTRKKIETLQELFQDKGPLEDIENIDLVCLPDVMMTEVRTLPDKVLKVQQDLLKYCQRMRDRFAILDTTGLVLDRQQVSFRHSLAAVGAVYHPWVLVKPFGRHRDQTEVAVPPCGHVAGVYARTDAEIGVHKAPANARLEGVVDLGLQLTNEEQAPLNDRGINCLRSFPGRGIQVWGARTLSTQPHWQYVNVRRLFLTVVRWIEAHMNDLVYEPNSPPLWERVKQRLWSFCHDLFKRGALKGRRQAEAFFVKCDAETNPLEVRNAGQLVAEVGLAPIAPAEFIVVHITQSVAGTVAAVSAL